MTELLAETYQGQAISVWQITEILRGAPSPSQSRLILVVDGRDRTHELQRATLALGYSKAHRIQEARQMLEEAKQWIDCPALRSPHSPEPRESV